MFRKALHDEIRNIFGLKAVDWAGALHDGADIVYVEYLSVREQYFSESHIRFLGSFDCRSLIWGEISLFLAS